MSSNKQYNPFADLENPEIRKQKEEKDKDYNSKQINPEDLEKSKKEAGKIFGENFNPDYKENLPSEEKDDIPEDPFASLENMDIQIPEKVEKQIYFPIINNLYNSGEIEQENFAEIIEQLENTNNTDEQKELITNFLKENTDSRENFNKINEYFNKQKNIDENNFSESDFAKEAQNANLNLDAPGDLEIMLAENFINIGGENKDNKENLKASIDITLNKLINNKSKEFLESNAELINEIRTGKNLESKYENLKELHKEYLLDDAKFGGKKAKENIAKKKKSIETKTQKIKKQLQEQVNNQELTQTEADKKWKEIQEKLQQEWIDNNKLEKEIQKIEGAIQAGELDKISGETENNETTK